MIQVELETQFTSKRQHVVKIVSAQSDFKNPNTYVFYEVFETLADTTKAPLETHQSSIPFTTNLSESFLESELLKLPKFEGATIL